MKLTLKNTQGKSLGEYEVKFPIIENGIGTQAVHEAVTAYRASQRSGNANTKTMGEVNGTGKKPWRQKGTGRARAGSFASPLWRGGGVVFGPKPRDFSKKVPKQSRRLALRKALGERLKAGDVVLLDELKMSSPKTKEFVSLLASISGGKSTLIVVAGEEKNMLLASRNVQRVEMTTSAELNTYQVLKYDIILFTKESMEKIEQRIA